MSSLFLNVICFLFFRVIADASTFPKHLLGKSVIENYTNFIMTYHWPTELIYMSFEVDWLVWHVLYQPWFGSFQAAFRIIYYMDH